MSRKRDTNWSRDEITILLDSIMEITKTRADDGKRTNSREVFEYAAKKMGEKGHQSRAEREKCRTKWKKMKEEFTHAKRAREGDSRYKEAPGIQPFYDRMEEFINGNFDNISPHSTIVRRTSSLSSSRTSSGMRTSARIAASTNGMSSTDNNDTSSTIVTRTNTSYEYPSTANTPTNASPVSKQNSSRLSSGSNSTCNTNNNNNSNNSANNNNNNNNPTQRTPSTTTAPATSAPQTLPSGQAQAQSQQQQQNQQQTIPNGGLCTIYTSYSNSTRTNDANSVSNNSTSFLNTSNESAHSQPTDGRADISYRVSTGFRQITIFGDHDVDIKFRGDRVTINKIDTDFRAATPTET